MTKQKIRFIIALILGSVLTGCATSYKKIELKNEDFTGKPLAITNTVPFVEQTPKLCGPTALYMVTKLYRPEITLDEVTQLTFTPAASGTYKQDLLSGARRLGMAPYKVSSFSQMIDYLAHGTPVILFHRTAFLWKDFWHYSVVTGYNRRTETFTLHIGPYEYRETDISDVIGSWMEGGSWSYAVLPPENLPSSVDYQEALENSFAFLRLGNPEAAIQLSEQMLKRWPDRYEADVVMAEALQGKNDGIKALLSLKKALIKKPENLALKQKIRELSKASGG